MPRKPLIVILGATSTGKSKLAVQIAKRFNGEIISADSVQVYRGLDISSNKISVEERCGIAHHMLDILKPSDRFTVLDYRNQALPIIENITRRNKLPILVGGSNYYIESILWKILVESEDERNRSFLVYDENQESRLGFVGKTNISQSATDAKDDRGIPYEEDASLYCAEDIGSKIRLVLNKFENTLKNIVRGGFEIPLSYYRNTFYPCHTATSHSSSSTRCSTTVDGQYSEESFDDDLPEIQSMVNVPDIELKLISSHVRMCLTTRRFNNGDRCDRDCNGGDYRNDEKTESISIENSRAALDTACVTYNRKMLKLLLTEPESFDWNFDELLKQLEANKWSLDYYHDISSNLIQGVSDIASMRAKRVALLRVIDDYLMNDFTSSYLYSQLKLVDPSMASTVHPNNRRKIIRSLQVFMATGRRHSDIIKDQCESEGGGLLGGPLRFQNSCIIWLQCDQDVLNERIDKRLKGMVDRGLIQELERFYEAYKAEIKSCHKNYEYDLGIFQSIGLKEFCRYLDLSEEERNTNEGRKLLQDSLDVMSMVTKRYSKYQVKWIQKRFIEIPNREVPSIYNLDSSSIENWLDDVEEPAYEIVNGYLNDKLVRAPLSHGVADPDRFIGGEFFCDICQRIFVGVYQWKIHLDSKRHQKALYRKKKRETILKENRNLLENV